MQSIPVTWLESIPHPGAPVRSALSRDSGGGVGDDFSAVAAASFESCLLFDHIPHDVRVSP